MYVDPNDPVAAYNNTLRHNATKPLEHATLVTGAQLFRSLTTWMTWSGLACVGVGYWCKSWGGMGVGAGITLCATVFLCTSAYIPALNRSE